MSPAGAEASFIPIYNQSSHQRNVHPVVMRYQRYSKNCDFTSDYTIQFVCNGICGIFYRFHSLLVAPRKLYMARILLFSLPDNIHITIVTITQTDIRTQKCCCFLTGYLAVTYLGMMTRSSSGVLEEASTGSQS